MELLAALVRSAIGYDANRGDQVEVVNMRFKSMEEAFQDEPPILWGFTKSEVMKMAEGLGVALVAILVILLVIRPLITKAFETSPMPEEHDGTYFGDPSSMGSTPLLGSGSGVPGIEGEGGVESELDELIDIARVEGRVKASSVRKIGEIIDKHPEEALSIIRTWMYQEE
jgi:flagellar M-ring protein FliF